jgi:integrase/recombinase XerD
MLRKQGILDGRSDWTDIDEWANHFAVHLLEVRGATKITKDNYVCYARRLMNSLDTAGRLDWTRLDANHVCRFVESELTKLSFNCRTQPVTAVRSFLRFLQSEGAIRPNLANAIPPVRTWRYSDIPRYLKVEQVQRLIAVCLEPNIASRRDRAMVLMMVRLGYGFGEVTQLHLDDIDWREGVIHVRSGKARTERVLPLPDDVGQAVVGYLREERPASQHRQMFLQTLAPYQGLSCSSVICRIAKRLLKQAGVEGPRLAAHCLRHSVATQMVRGGASFQQVADVLGHKALQSTAVYAKLDDQALLQVALPWPGGAE